MKNRIMFLMIALLLMTGCTCEYNLTIDDNVYHEQLNIVGSSNEEIISLNNKWQIPVNRDEYKNISIDPDTNIKITGDIYEYKLFGNKLTFNYDFTKSSFANSSAISVCYDKVTVNNYQDSIVVSTSNKVKCFDSYPSLTSVKINIKIDKPVTTHNADSVNNNVYTWNLTRNNSSNKGINVIIENETKDLSSTDNSSTNNNKSGMKEKKNDYTLYIFCGILLVIFLIGYFIFKNKAKEDLDV